MTASIHPSVEPYLPLVEGVVALFAPLVEVAIHDIGTGKITAIYNNITRRTVGDLSPVTELKIPVAEFPDVFEPYYETNWDGRKIKCTTVTVRGDDAQPVALICFNFDVSLFVDIQGNLATFLAVKKNTANPVELYSQNWQEKIDTQITEYLTQEKLIVGKLTRSQKQAVIEELARHGVFFLKNAAPYVAAQLGISRATVYNYLKVLRSET